MASRPLPLTSSAGVRRVGAGARLVTLLAVAALAGCGGGGSRSHDGANGHLHGTVTRGPTTPVCRTGTPCSGPASGQRLVFKSGSGSTSVVAAKDGSYSVSLPPGLYAVAVLPLQIGHIVPSTVRVVAGKTRNVDFQIDTGMR
ncbi:MAG TPA: hypothetical protein VGH79_04705 [Gaiellaceae bacterium]|jgi:hypothetical protein